MGKIGLIIILTMLVIILLAYLYFIKKEIKNVTNQLNNYNIDNTRKKIDISLFDKDIEYLATSINNHIDIHRESIIKQKKAEDELKMAIANISHDIRIPLTSILGYIQMSKRNNMNDDKRLECMDIAESKAKLLKSILEDFFSLSIIQSPEYNIDIEYVNLNNILCESISTFYEELNNRDLNINIEDKNMIVLGNKGEINRIIENLIANLIKYSKGDEEISLVRKDDEAILTISNKVNNVDDKDIKLFFDRFYKQDISRENNNSSGLGLSIVKTLIEKMGGNIKVELTDNRIYLICVWKIAYGK